MKKEAIGFLTACVMGAGLFGGTTAWAGSDPQFFLDRLVEVRGCPPREDNFTDETRRESKLALLAGRSLKSKAKTLKASAGLSPRPGQKLWVFYDSVCRGSVVVKGFQAKKVGGKVPVLAWFDFKKSSLPVSINGNGHWMDRAVYL
ncbi:MAG: hypothetical protein ACREL1_01805, partial [bacterium]